jgi:hypothetical protein
MDRAAARDADHPGLRAVPLVRKVRTADSQQEKETMKHVAMEAIPRAGASIQIRCWCGAGDHGPLDVGDSIVFDAVLGDCPSCDAAHAEGRLAAVRSCRGTNHVMATSDADTCQCGARQIERAPKKTDPQMEAGHA